MSGVWNLGRMRHRFDASPELIDAISMPGLPAGSTASLGATLWKTCGRPVDDPRRPAAWHCAGWTGVAQIEDYRALTGARAPLDAGRDAGSASGDRTQEEQARGKSRICGETAARVFQLWNIPAEVEKFVKK